MKKVFLIMVIALFVSGCVHLPGDPWTKADTFNEVLFLGALTLDYLNTKQTVKDPMHEEGNKTLGPNPDQNNIDAYFGICFLGHPIIARVLPAKKLFTIPLLDIDVSLRRLWQWGWTAREAWTCKNSHDHGIRP